MNYAYILGAVIIAVGLQFLIRGYLRKSNARMVAGIAVMLAGASQFFQQQSIISVTLLFLGLVVFMLSLYMLKLQHGRIVRPDQRRRRR